MTPLEQFMVGAFLVVMVIGLLEAAALVSAGRLIKRLVNENARVSAERKRMMEESEARSRRYKELLNEFYGPAGPPRAERKVAN
jgi:hypothetical protein